MTTEMFIDPATLSPEVIQFLTWQAAQPNSVGPGTIGDAWAQGGTGPFYAPHVATAQETLQHHILAVAECIATGVEPPVAPWTLPIVPMHDDRAQADGATFGDTSS